jgi:V8-like Glu-specific endopeptidase
MTALPIATTFQQVAVVSPYAVDGSAVVQVVCDKESGTAFYLGNGLFMTAKHVPVADEHCRIGPSLITIVSRGALDWSIVRANFYPPYRVAYSCDRVPPGRDLLVTGYAEGNGWQVTTHLRATDSRDRRDGSLETKGPIIPGQSGAPVADLDGVVYGIASWTRMADDDLDALPASGIVEMADTALCSSRKGR